jgi:lipopolysaccharide/colanic/teichoic acid biosynthesis glycosyltransferase
MIAQYRSQEIDRFAQNSLSAAAIEGSGAPRAEAAQVVQFARYSDAAIQQDRPGGLYRRVFKRGLDIALILASLPGWLPLIVLFALGNVLTGNAPFYSQPRLGKGGRVFRMWKLRSMVADADDALADLLARDTALRQEWETNQKLRMDPRITPLGRLLRKTSIDELPQLLNVLMGT